MPFSKVKNDRITFEKNKFSSYFSYNLSDIAEIAENNNN